MPSAVVNERRSDCMLAMCRLALARFRLAKTQALTEKATEKIYI